MRRTLSLAFTVLTAVALFVGCTKNPINGHKSELELSNVSANETKAVIDGTIFPKDGHIGLFLFKDESAVSPYGDTGCSNVEYSYNGGNDKWTANPPITVGGEPGHLYGYYPYSSSVTDIKSIPVASSLDGDDVMYATKQTVTDETASQTAIKMNHALARVTITVVNKGYTLGKGELSSIKFSGAEASVNGILDATSGIISGTTKADVTLEVPSGKQSITAEGTVYECLLVPSEEESLVQTLDLTLNIDGNDQTTTLSGDTGITIARNTKSNITITLSNSGISVQTVSIEDWNVVEVGGYKVTVKLDEEVEDIEKDVWVMAFAQDGNAVIKSFSSSGKTITCQLDDDTMVEPVSDENISVFKLSDVSEDIIATIGVFGEGGRKEVTVNGHKVKVVYDEVEDIVKDVWAAAYVKGSDVIINATSLKGKGLVCNVEGDVECEKTITDNIFTFTISEIPSNIEAVLCYMPSVTVIVSSDSNGKAWIGDDESKTSGQFYSGQQVVIHASPNDKFRLFKWNDNNRETNRTITVGENDAEYFANFISSDLIPGLFTVNSDKKQVFFSKGNLYYDGSAFNFEANQYDTTPSRDGDRVDNHISHFMWCDDATNALALKYDDSWNGNNKSFFAAKDFTVNGYSGWRVLTGGDGGEWEYLLNNRETAYGTNRRYAAVKVNGISGLLIFPDDFSSWPSGAGDEPTTFNTNSSNWNDKNYTVEQFNTLQNNGCVFLPAAGFRDGDPGLPNPALVGSVGYYGYYWSASPDFSDFAYDLRFYSGNVNPNYNDTRDRAKSVRLVTE